MKTRGRRDYGWDEAARELGAGVHPEVVAARLGEPIDYVLEVAGAQGWPITWQGPSAEQIADAFRWTDA